MKEKKATWPEWGRSVFGRFYWEMGCELVYYMPAYAKMIFVTASNAS